MRKLFSGLAVFFFGVIVLTAVASPLCYWGIHPFWDIPFRRIFNRVLMLSAVSLIWPLTCYWGVNSWGKLGLKDSRKLRNFLRWFLIGFISMMLLASVQLLLGIRAWNSHFSLLKLLEFIASALAVAFLEEILFRGLLFQALRGFLSRNKLMIWVFLMAFIFASLHFLKAQDMTSPVTWQSGWMTFAQIFPSNISGLLPRWFSLFLVGLILYIVTWKSHSLWPAIGLHAGWVFCLKCSESFTEGSSMNFLFGADLITGIIPSIFLIILLILFISNERLVPKSS